jgi:hypothetical protein
VPGLRIVKWPELIVRVAAVLVIAVVLVWLEIALTNTFANSPEPTLFDSHIGCSTPANGGRACYGARSIAPPRRVLPHIAVWTTLAVLWAAAANLLLVGWRRPSPIRLRVNAR